MIRLVRAAVLTAALAFGLAAGLVSAEAVHIREMELMLMKRAPD